MNTLSHQTLVFYSILAVILLLCFYALYRLLGSCKVKTELKQDLTDEQRDQLEQLNEEVGKLKSQLSSCKRISGIKDTEIKRLKQLKDKPVANLDFSFKKGAKVKGRLLPHGKNYITGVFFEKTRRGNIKLESGQIIDPVDAIEVF
jgi:hypothetical protein